MPLEGFDERGGVIVVDFGGDDAFLQGRGAILPGDGGDGVFAGLEQFGDDVLADGAASLQIMLAGGGAD